MNRTGVWLKSWILLAAALSASSSSADFFPELSNYFNQKISVVSGAVCSEADAQAPDDDSSTMVLQDVNVDISPSISFGVSSVLSLTISPEVDLVFVPEYSNSDKH